MPTYEYRCTECGRHMEVQQSFTDPPRQECEFCSGKLRRIFSPVGVMFKGSGFYSTDARSDARSNSRKSEDKSSNGEKGPDKQKTDPGPKESKPSETKSAPGDGAAHTAKKEKADKQT